MSIILHNLSEEDDLVKQYGEYNSPDQIYGLDAHLTFDGVYKNVYENRMCLADKDVTLFVMGDYVGADNSTIDPDRPLEYFCDWNEIMEMVTMYNCKLGWHTWSHPDLTEVNDERLRKEVTPPFPMETFAYPYGKFDDRVIEAVKAAGYKEAYSVERTDGTQYTKVRTYLH